MQDECFCGECGPCRRALRAIDRELIGWKPILELPVEKRKVAQKQTTERNTKRDAKATAPVTPKKESRPKLTPVESNRQRRQILREQRIMIDGYWFHPKPDLIHGTSNARKRYGCACPECRAFGRENYHKYGPKSRKQNAVADQ
jgi:hypothetical protein